jgi:hypothetical protein
MRILGHNINKPSLNLGDALKPGGKRPGKLPKPKLPKPNLISNRPSFPDSVDPGFSLPVKPNKPHCGMGIFPLPFKPNKPHCGMGIFPLPFPNCGNLASKLAEFKNWWGSREQAISNIKDNKNLTVDIREAAALAQATVDRLVASGANPKQTNPYLK